MLFAFHCHSYWNRNWIYRWLNTFKTDHVTRLDFRRFCDDIFWGWRFSSIPHILTVLSLSWWCFIFISMMISDYVLGNLNSPFLHSFFTFFLMFLNLPNHHRFLTNCTHFSTTTAGFLMFLDFRKCVSILAKFTVNGFSWACFRMIFKYCRWERFLAKFALLIRMLLGLS